MTRVALLALLLGGCGLPPLMPDAGAPPRPLPSDVKLVIVEVPQADIGDGGWSGFQRDKVSAGDGVGGLLGYSVANTGTDGKYCRIVIAKELMGVERERVLAHEKRHCAGQQHILRNGTYVWLP
jgi:hypothetical protein